ncbi:MAG: transcription elongation factor GreA [Candidatus Omnitrophota bacterium]
MDEIYLTQDGYEKLIQELEYLRSVKRKKISEAIAQARAQGDISENAEYDAAKDAQALNEQRISELEDKLARARIIDNEGINSDEALLGAKVKLKDLDTEEEIEYLLVSELEADYDSGKISVTSPVGKGLLGHKKGEEVEIKVPAGVLRYKILEVTR